MRSQTKTSLTINTELLKIFDAEYDKKHCKYSGYSRSAAITKLMQDWVSDNAKI